MDILSLSVCVEYSLDKKLIKKVKESKIAYTHRNQNYITLTFNMTTRNLRSNIRIQKRRKVSTET
jgi:hypothetical protein